MALVAFQHVAVCLDVSLQLLQETHFLRPHTYRKLTTSFYKDVYSYLINMDQFITSHAELIYTLKSTIQ